MMKKIFIILIFIIGQNFSFAQPYHLLPDSNASWVVGQYLSTPWTYQWYIYYTSINKNDTIINSKFYTKLYGGMDGVSAYRSDTLGRTWYVPHDSTNEYLIMDVSKNVGDTIYNLITEAYTCPGTAVVDSIRYISVGPYTLKQLALHPVPHTGFYWYWIEKIGCTSGFFNRCFGIMEPQFTYCMSFNDTTYYKELSFYSGSLQCCPTYTFGVCSIPININETLLQNENVNIYPNPFSSSLSVVFNNQSINYGINIYNSQGMICKSFLMQSVSQDVKINLSELVSGLYLIKIEDKERNSFITKKIIKE